MSKKHEYNANDVPSSDKTLTRKEFISKTLKGAAVAGALLYGPRVVDKFLVPKAYALVSYSSGTCSTTNSNSDLTSSNKVSDNTGKCATGTGADAITCSGFSIAGDCQSTGSAPAKDATGNGSDSGCVNGQDVGLSC